MRLPTLATAAALLAAVALLAACSEDASLSISGPAAFDADGSPAGDRYDAIAENPFVLTAAEPVSTFSVDADGASYANVRRFITREGLRPPADAVRTEEFLNYFDLHNPYDDDAHPVAVSGEVSACPWRPEHRLIRIGLRGAPLPDGERVPQNFTFLIDVSGSMQGSDRLDLLKTGFAAFAKTLDARDRVAVVTYGSASTLALAPTPGNEHDRIIAALDALGAGGSTAGAAGITTAYDLAEESFIAGGNNRVVVGTDGDFNVGVSSREALVELIEERRGAGVFLTVVGVGRGNLNDASLEQIANRGNGTYEYAATARDIEKVFVHEVDKFTTVAQDVKIQVAFDTAVVQAYRLIGYENRVLANGDFGDDAEDAGEIGANQSITALYEVKPVDGDGGGTLEEVQTSTVYLRYKRPGATESVFFSTPVFDAGAGFRESSDRQRFSAASAAFALTIRNSDYRGTANADSARVWLETTAGMPDAHGYKRELAEVMAAFGRL